MPRGGWPQLKFKEFADLLDDVDKLSGRNEIIDLLSSILGKMTRDEIASGCYLVLGKLRPDYEGVELGLGEKLIMKALSEATASSINRVKELYDKLGDLGLVAYELKRTQGTGLLGAEYLQTLSVGDVHARLLETATIAGEGAQRGKLKAIEQLISRCSPVEAKYLLRFCTGDLRLGFAEQTVLAALAKAYAGGDSEAVERAYNITSDVGYVAEKLALKGVQGLGEVHVTPGRPLKPMLAERASSIEEILERMNGVSAFEYKYDGERVQAHRVHGQTILFSRRGEKISGHYPDVVEQLQDGVRADSFIVEGEIIAVDPSTGEMLPFQQLMHRRRKYKVEEAKRMFPAKTILFDLLYVDGVDYTSRPYTARRKALEKHVHPSDYLELSVAETIHGVDLGVKFFEQAVEAGCEGIMAKSIDQSMGYKAGKRGWAWIKYKRDYRSDLTDTLDLVVVGGFYGRGRRAGRIGAYLLAAYNPSTEGFETVCKVATGFSDQDLAEIPSKLKAHEIPARHPSVSADIHADVWYRPAVLMEVAGAELTLSPIHTAARSTIREGSGLAVRFPRFTGILRVDKSPEEATTTDELVEMYRRQIKKVE